MGTARDESRSTDRGSGRRGRMSASHSSASPTCGGAASAARPIPAHEGPPLKQKSIRGALTPLIAATTPATSACSVVSMVTSATGLAKASST